MNKRKFIKDDSVIPKRFRIAESSHVRASTRSQGEWTAMHIGQSSDRVFVPRRGRPGEQQSSLT